MRDHVERHQRTAEGGSALRFSKPDDIIDRLVRSLVGAGPFEKFFVQPDLADEVSFKRDVITYFTRDGRQMIDREPTSEAELTAICQRLLADAGVAVDLENPVVVHQVWGNQVRASVSIPPVSDCLDGTFRIYRPHRTDLTDLVELGSMSPQAANFVAAFQRAPTGVSGDRRAWQRQVDDRVGAPPGHSRHDDHPHRAGDPRTGRAAPAGRAMVS